MITSILNTLRIFKKQNIFLILFYSLILIITEVISISLLFPLMLIVFNKENIILTKFEYFLVDQNLIFINFFITFILFLLSIYFLRFILSTLLGFKIADFKASIQKFYSKLALKYFLYGPYINFKNHNSNEFSVLVSKETEKFASAVDALVKIFTEGLIIFLILSVLLYQNFLISILLITVLIVLFLFTKFFFNPFVKRWGERYTHHDINRMTSLNEIFNLIKEIKIFGKTKDFIRKYSFDNARTQIAQRNRLFFSLFIRNFIELSLVAFIIFTIVFVNFKGVKLENFFPTISFFFLALLRTLPSGIKILNSIQLILFSKKSIDFTSNLAKFHNNLAKLGEGNYLIDKSQKELRNTIKKKKNSLILKKISFGYKNDKVINNLSIKFDDNNIIGIKGQSGSGKTTLVEIILGLIKPNSGKILLNNRNIKDLGAKWKNKISYVSQDNNLFSGSAYQNIAFEPDIRLLDKEDIKNLIKKINLRFYKKFKNKLNKKIHFNSRNLSGGEKQRLSIARGLFRHKDIIILDEITSSLDNENETEILKELKKFKKNKIIIIVSHKKSSLKVCDKIYELKDLKLKKIK